MKLIFHKQKAIIRVFVIVFFSGFFLNLNAQKLEGTLPNKIDTTYKKILDNARYRVYYAMEYVNDSTNVQLKSTGQTLLLIGSRYNAFLDYNSLRRDSVYDSFFTKKGATAMEVFSTVLPIARQVKFAPIIIKNYPQKDSCTFQREVVANEVYRYIFPVKIQWSLGKGEKEIMGYSCKNASCSYCGRQYTAWYAPDIPISEGPYVFSGLPGLILSISDSRGHYSFTINGLKTINTYDPIYLPSNHVIEASRDQVRKMVRNTYEDPSLILKALAGQGIEVTGDDSRAKIQSKPYNPIELE